MTQIHRLAGGQIDRDQTHKFLFDGKSYTGHQGDTLASALLANGVRLMGRSFKYHCPRGVLTAESEEPNALVELREGARQEPNTRATTIELFDGLLANTQNKLGSLSFDLLAVNDRLSNFLTAGFYYKTFMWPKAFWEPIVRRAAGLGSLSLEDDPDVYDKGFLHCDLLITGAGPSGLSAALTAGRSGAQIILADEDFRMVGRLNSETFSIGDAAGADWAAGAVAELASMPNVRVMPRTTVIGAFDHGIYGAVERLGDHTHTPETDKPRQVLWRIYTKGTILAAVAADKCVAIFTNNDNGHRTAIDLHARGSRSLLLWMCGPMCRALDDEVLHGEVENTMGRLGLTFAKIKLADDSTRTLECGALGMSGGWNPNVHMTCHRRGRPTWNETLSAFVPGGDLPPAMVVAGAANGDMSTHAASMGGAKAAKSALGLKGRLGKLPQAEDAPVNLKPFSYVEGCSRAWLHQQNDVTVKDVKLSHQEGFRSVEHLKRYTTLGMATDQGKTSNMGGLAIMAELAGKTIPEVETTMFRPPYTPTAIGGRAGRHPGQDFHPRRLTPSHKWAQEQGAVFVEVGNWMRAQWFPRAGETTWCQSVDREVLATRKSVGVCDVTTLGKIDVQGSDAAAFLNKIYCNGFAKLAVGKTRYGLMLREDGIAMDDGTGARLVEDHFVVTTTTANALAGYRHMEFVRHCLFPDRDVQLISTSEPWAQYAVAGPNSRKLLEKNVDQDISNEAAPSMACANITI